MMAYPVDGGPDRRRATTGSPAAGAPSGGQVDLERLEIDLLLSGVWRHWGFDFRDYASEWVKRRIARLVAQEKVGTVSGLQQRVLHDPAAMGRLLVALAGGAGGFFRQPRLYRTLRERVVGHLATYPSVRVWVAGCSGGGDVVSLAIVLAEEGLYDRTRIYATDLGDAVLERARRWRYPREWVEAAGARYREAGGRDRMSRYFDPDGAQSVVRPELARNVVFAPHNVATDAAFNEFHLIMCVHGLSRLGPALQRRVFDLFHASLARLGLLVLGPRQHLTASPHAACYDRLPVPCGFYRKVRASPDGASLQGREMEGEVKLWSPPTRPVS